MKIKKYALNLLILIALIGTFSPIQIVYADPLGDCLISVPRGHDYVTPNQTKQQCDVANGTWTGYSAADACASVTGIGGIICRIQKILNSIIPVLLALGLIYFVWGVVQYVIGDDGEAKKKGRNHIIYGIIGFAIILGVWGLVNIVVNTFGIGGVATPALPTLATPDSCVAITDTSKFADLLNYVTCVIYKSVVPLIFALALVMFVWGVIQLVINSSDEAKKKKGRQFMMWGIIALAVMVSVWGLVNLLTTTFGLKNPVVPQVRPR